jgi:hypothetical protein
MKILHIEIPKGYEIDQDNSTFEKIVFKEIKKDLPKFWQELRKIDGYYASSATCTLNKAEGYATNPSNRSIFVTKEQAEASIALAQLSQLREVYRQGWRPDWLENKGKWCLLFYCNRIVIERWVSNHQFLSFQTEEIAKEFLYNFRDLIKQARPLMS